jgi:hypothetical protein
MLFKLELQLQTDVIPKGDRNYESGFNASENIDQINLEFRYYSTAHINEVTFRLK